MYLNEGHIEPRTLVYNVEMDNLIEGRGGPLQVPIPIIHTL